MPGQLQRGAGTRRSWPSRTSPRPASSTAQQVLADLDQGAVLNLPVDGYVATQAWARAHPATAAAFTRAIEQGQAIANSDVSAVQAIMAAERQPAARGDRVDGAALLLPGRPGGTGGASSASPPPCSQFGVLSQQYATQVRQGTLVRSMITSG